MSRIQLQATHPARPLWNKGWLIDEIPALLPRQAWAIRTGLELANNRRDLILSNLAIDGKHCGCDQVRLKFVGLAPTESSASVFPVMQRKTKGHVQFVLYENTQRSASLGYVSDYAWPGVSVPTQIPRLSPSLDAAAGRPR